jgi:hypothetical protein
MSFLHVPTQPCLEIASALNSEAWQNPSSSAPAWWNTYLNQVCLQTILPWFQTEYDATVRSGFAQNESQPLWQLVNGTALTTESYRVILIPAKTFDTSEFRVPQEWVDLPSWAGDYYFAVQVDPDDASILIWGYTTHKQLKTKGNYDADDRTYVLDAQQMVQDFAAFSVVRELCPQEETRVEIAALPEVPIAQAENLLQRLANSDILQPRLEVPFQLWGALMEQPQWRQQLGERHLGAQSIQRTVTSTIAHLGQWLQNTFEEGWQSLDTLLGREPAMAYSFRQTEVNSSAVQRVKVLELAEQTFWLAVVLEPEADNRIAIRIQLRSAEVNGILPVGLSLTMLTHSGSVVQSVEARDQDNVIQLKRFRCAIGTEFSIQVALDATSLMEEFTV